MYGLANLKAYLVVGKHMDGRIYHLHSLHCPEVNLNLSMRYAELKRQIEILAQFDGRKAGKLSDEHHE